MNCLPGRLPERFLLGALLIVCGNTLAANSPVPVPKSTPLPMNVSPGPGTGPFLLSTRTFVPLDLGKVGYTEDEYAISGNANVYDWALDGSLTVKASGPYTTRILVRHPTDPARFSGTVVVELNISARRFDWPMIWSYLKEPIVDRGDAWVGITMPGAVPGLLKYNSARYSELSFKNPSPGACPKANAEVEEGLRFDMISQVGAALKSGAPGQPLAGFHVQYLYMTSQLGEITTYINAIQRHTKTVEGKPIYDGFLVKALGAQGGPSRINQCAVAPAKDDPRFLVHDVGVPVLSVTPQSEVIEAFNARRPDSDAPSDKFRAWEVAGSMHLTLSSYDGMANMVDQAAAGTAQGTTEWPFNARCTPEIAINQNPLEDYIFHAALYDLDDWVRKGIPPPQAPRIAVKGSDTPNPTVELDQYGNAIGGVRTFVVDLPVATYFMLSAGPGTCREFGHTVPFDWGRLESIYGSYKNYAAKVAESVEQSVRARWITKSDAQKLMVQLKVSGEPQTIGPPVSTNGAFRQ